MTTPQPGYYVAQFICTDGSLTEPEIICVEQLAAWHGGDYTKRILSIGREDYADFSEYKIVRRIDINKRWWQFWR